MNLKERKRECIRKCKARAREAWAVFMHEIGLDICQECGYNKCPDAIEFHHSDPSDKKVTIAVLKNLTLTDETVERFLEEIAKCDVLCANCHRELHWEEKND